MNSKNIFGTIRILIISLAAVLAAACHRAQPVYVDVDGQMLGTFLHITAETDRPASDIYDRMMRIDAEAKSSMSIFDENSLLNRINRNLTDSVDRHIAFNLELAGRINAVSDGAYDVTVKPLVEAYGFAAKDRTKNPDIDSIMEFVGFDKLRVENGRLIKSDPRVQIDFNSIAKGYVVDMAAAALEEMGIENYIVDIGGEVRCRGQRAKGGPWRVGVETPFDGNQIPGAYVQQVISLTDCAFATSGNYRRYYIDEQGRKVAHTIDPRSGRSAVSDLLSATVIAPTCAEADAFGTMFMALGKDEAIAKARELESKGISVYFITSNADGGFEVYYSESLAPSLKHNEGFHTI